MKFSYYISNFNIYLLYIMNNTINEPEELFEFINNQLMPNEKSKAEHGEVFTPLVTVNEMFDILEIAYKNKNGKSIFMEKDFKWFDPAVGIGNFPIILYQRLMKGLEPIIKREEERKKHILEKMIYVSELTKKNILIYKKIFCFETYKLNIYEGDTLELNSIENIKNNIFTNLSNDFNGFDVVMGNPPYNAEGIKHKGKKNIYVNFSIKTLDIWLKKSGFLLFIHPPTYRIPHHVIQCTKKNLNKIYTSKKILCIKMFSVPQILKLMFVMMNVDIILIENMDNENSNVRIIDTKGNEENVIIKVNDFIPNFGLKIMNKLKNKSEQGKIELYGDSQMHAQNTSGTKYKNVHGITKHGLKICMSDEKHKDYNKPKLIINGIGSHMYVFYDEKGEYGVTQSPLIINEPSKNTIQFIQSSLFHYIINSTKIIGNNINKKSSLFLPIIPENLKINTINDLYKYFDFTNDENNEINSFHIPKYKNKEFLIR